MTEMDLGNRVSKISDEEALDAFSYMASWMGEQAKMEGKLTAIPDDRGALEMLGTALPELVGPLKNLSDNENQKARVARNVLLFMVEQDCYTSKVEEAIDRPALRGDPLTVGLSTGFFLLLLLEFELKYIDKKGGKRVFKSLKNRRF